MGTDKNLRLFRGRFYAPEGVPLELSYALITEQLTAKIFSLNLTTSLNRSIIDLNGWLKTEMPYGS